MSVPIDIRHTDLAQSLIREGREEARAEAREEGRAEMMALVLRAWYGADQRIPSLARRFARLSADGAMEVLAARDSLEAFSAALAAKS
jgi:hypothetical protein